MTHGMLCLLASPRFVRRPREDVFLIGRRSLSIPLHGDLPDSLTSKRGRSVKASEQRMGVIRDTHVILPGRWRHTQKVQVMGNRSDSRCCKGGEGVKMRLQVLLFFPSLPFWYHCSNAITAFIASFGHGINVRHCTRCVPLKENE